MVLPALAFGASSTENPPARSARANAPAHKCFTIFTKPPLFFSNVAKNLCYRSNSREELISPSLTDVKSPGARHDDAGLV